MKKRKEEIKEKFFKLPLDKLLEKLSAVLKEPLEFNVSQKAMFDGLEEHRFWVHISARRTGKSYAASVLALAKLLEPGTQVMVVAPNFTLSSIIWDYVTKFIDKLGLEKNRSNQKERVIELINGSVFRLLSANNRDSLVGRGAHLLIVDEAAVIDNDEYFTRDLRPALSTYPNSRALFISTPRGTENYLYKYFLRGQDDDAEWKDWGSALYTWEANPRLVKSDIEAAKKEQGKTLFAQEYECSWLSFEGQIYEMDRTRHLAPVRKYATTRPMEYIAGLDIGYRDETAFVVVATTGENWFIIDAYTSKEDTTSTHATIIQKMIELYDIDIIYIDAAAAQMKADLAQDYDIYCTNAQKSVLDGIAALQVLVEQDQEITITLDDGTKKKIVCSRLVIDEECEDVYKALAAYRWNDKTEKQKPRHDNNSHYSDAIRYAIYSHMKNNVDVYSLRD